MMNLAGRTTLRRALRVSPIKQRLSPDFRMRGGDRVTPSLTSSINYDGVQPSMCFVGEMKDLLLDSVFTGRQLREAINGRNMISLPS